MTEEAERRGGRAIIGTWLPACVLLMLWAAAVLWPLMAGTGDLLRLPRLAGAGDPVIVPMRPMNRILLETVLYALPVALLAGVIGWPAGHWLAAARGGRSALVRRAWLLLPIVTPAFVVFYTWWQAWPPGSALFRFAVEREVVTQLRTATLIAGLVCWSWPIVAWCVAACVRERHGRERELLRLDGARWRTRFMSAVSRDRAGLLTGMLIVFMLTFSNTTCFDLAQVYSVGNELRAFASLGASPAEVLRASIPTMILLAALCAVVGMVHMRTRSEGRTTSMRVRPAGRFVTAATLVIFAISVAVPAVLLARGSGGWEGFTRFMRLLSGPAGESALVALGVSALLALIAVCAVLSDAQRRGWRMLVGLMAFSWLVFAAVPGTSVAALLQSGWISGDGLRGVVGRALLLTPVALLLGGVARFGIIALLLALQAKRHASAAASDCRALDGVRGLIDRCRAQRPSIMAAAIAAAAVGWVLMFAEIPVTARLHPPGSDPLSIRLLNAMHYQREEMVMVACLMLLLIAAAVAWAMSLPMVLSALRATVSARGAGQTASRAFPFVLMLVLVGCGVGDEVAPLRPIATFGRPGVSLGQFAYPRAIAADAQRGFVYVVDKTARIQQFDLEGRPLHEWRMPESRWGKPVGLSVHPDGRVFVADTHYHRVIVFTPEGEELLRFGAFGEGPGGFIYPTDIAFLADGSILVSEYGGNDRVQVFSPDGTYLRSFGRFGRGPGELDRPQGILLSPDGSELFIADACNHRLLVFDPADGRFLRALGGAGIAPGEMHYPYDLAWLGDGTLMIAEFGNNRVQRIDPNDGRSLALHGGLGTDEGRVQFPWGVAVIGDRLFVLDSGNNRVQIMRVR